MCLHKVTGRISVVNWGSSIWKEKPAGDWVTIGAWLEDKCDLSFKRCF